MTVWRKLESLDNIDRVVQTGEPELLSLRKSTVAKVRMSERTMPGTIHNWFDTETFIQ